MFGLKTLGRGHIAQYSLHSQWCHSMANISLYKRYPFVVLVFTDFWILTFPIFDLEKCRSRSWSTIYVMMPIVIIHFALALTVFEILRFQRLNFGNLGHGHGGENGTYAILLQVFESILVIFFPELLLSGNMWKRTDFTHTQRERERERERERADYRQNLQSSFA